MPKFDNRLFLPGFKVLKSVCANPLIMHIAKVKARDLWHLTNRVARKVLAHTLAIAINKLKGNSPLQFEKLGIA